MKFGAIFTKRCLVKRISTQDATSKYLSWLRDKEIKKNLACSNIIKLKQLKSYIKRNVTDKNTLFLKIIHISVILRFTKLIKKKEVLF